MSRPVAGGRDRLTHGLQPAGWPGRRRLDDSLIDWADHELGVRLEVVERSDDVDGFHVLPAAGWLSEPSAG
jgi:hypothetical protein